MTRRRLAYSVGFTLPENTPDLLKLIPEGVWVPAYGAHDQVRDGAWVAELTDLMDLSAWPAGMRVIVRKERPHPDAQLRFEDVDGMRLTAFVINTTREQLADLELRHRPAGARHAGAQRRPEQSDPTLELPSPRPAGAAACRVGPLKDAAHLVDMQVKAPIPEPAVDRKDHAHDHHSGGPARAH